MWGWGEEGQLGTRLGGGAKTVDTPQCVSSFGSSKLVVALAIGKRHTLALTNGLELFAWGSNDSGQLGISSLVQPVAQSSPQKYLSRFISLVSVYQPTAVKGLAGKGICRIACGNKHSCALSLSGLLYTWGSNKRGQLGHPLAISWQGIPMIVKTLIGRTVTNVLAGHKCTLAMESIALIQRDMEYFDSWKSAVISEEQKDFARMKNESATEERKARNLNKTVIVSHPVPEARQIAEDSFVGSSAATSQRRSLTRRFRRKKLGGESPIIVTGTMKLYKFRRSAREDVRDLL